MCARAQSLLNGTHTQTHVRARDQRDASERTRAVFSSRDFIWRRALAPPNQRFAVDHLVEKAGRVVLVADAVDPAERRCTLSPLGPPRAPVVGRVCLRVGLRGAADAPQLTLKADDLKNLGIVKVGWSAGRRARTCVCVCVPLSRLCARAHTARRAQQTDRQDRKAQDATSRRKVGRSVGRRDVAGVCVGSVAARSTA